MKCYAIIEQDADEPEVASTATLTIVWSSLITVAVSLLLIVIVAGAFATYVKCNYAVCFFHSKKRT